MSKQVNRKQGVLGVCIAVLFALACLTFPFAFNLTWSAPYSNADRTITYTTNKLEWDASAPTNADGTINLELFKPEYDNVKSEDGENIVAPGTSNSRSVRFMNESTAAIRYWATLYRTDATGANVVAHVTGDEDAELTDQHYYPDGVNENDVVEVETRTGMLTGSNTTQLGVNWEWVFEESKFQDTIDTMVGNTSDGKVEYGLYVVCEEVEVKTVTFKMQGGTMDGQEEVTVEVGTTVDRPTPDPVRPNYRFKGWYCDPSCTQPFDFSQPITEDTTLYAGWVRVYTVSFEMDGGTPAEEAQTVDEGSMATHPAHNPTRDGYVFAGWYSDAACTESYGFNTPVTSDMTIYAKWSPVPVPYVEYTVTFDTGEGSAVASQKVASGGVAEKPADPTREGYTFAGWYSDAACTQEYDFNTAVTADVTIYAKWTENTTPVNPDDNKDDDNNNNNNNNNNSNSSSSTSGTSTSGTSSTGSSSNVSGTSAKAKGLTIPTTGDNTQMATVFALVVLALVGVIVAAIADRRRARRRRAAAASGVHGRN